MKLFSSQRGVEAWTEAQAQALTTLQSRHGNQPLGDAFCSNVLRADGSIDPNVNEMRVHLADAYSVAKLIDENRWLFVLDPDGFVIDLIPATTEAREAAMRESDDSSSHPTDLSTMGGEDETEDGLDELADQIDAGSRRNG